jgi:predicted O-methyltransferase YrrM
MTDIGTLAKQFASPMMDAAELEFLAQNMLESVRSGEGLRGVEIGTFYGDTTLYCLNVLRGAGVRADWFTIDPFDLFTEPDERNPQGRAPKYLSNLRASEFSSSVTTIVATSEQAARLIPNDIDFLFIDGGHSYEVCHFDLLNYAQKLRGGGGLFVDDYIPDYEGVMRACDEFFAAHSNFRIIDKRWFVSARKL